MEHGNTSPLIPKELAVDNESAIKTIVTEQFELPAEDLTVMYNDSYISELDGSFTFMVRHSTGIYAVNAHVSETGELEHYTATNLQLSLKEILASEF